MSCQTAFMPRRSIIGIDLTTLLKQSEKGNRIVNQASRGGSIQPNSTGAWQHNHADPASGGEAIQTYNNEGSTNLNFLSQQQIQKMWICYTLMRRFCSIEMLLWIIQPNSLIHKSEVRLLESLQKSISAFTDMLVRNKTDFFLTMHFMFFLF